MNKYRLTFLGLVISILVLICAITFDLDLFERLVTFLHRFENYEVDEFIIPVIIFLIFMLLDLFKRRKLRRVELEKFKIYKAMLASTQHILNNFLNQMQLFKITADKIPAFDPEILALFDRIINDATTQIEALSNITSINQDSIEESVSPSKSI